MADAQTIMRWLDVLREQTDFGNANWRQESGRDSYFFAASEGTVLLSSRDHDGLLPYSLAVANPDGEIFDEWIIYGTGGELDAGDAAPEWLASRARALYAAVKKQIAIDPIYGMLKELEQMPPF